MKSLDPRDLDRLLDEVEPPLLPPDFAARIATAAMAEPQGDMSRPSGDRTGPWATRHRTLAAVSAATLLIASAIAAAIVSGHGIDPLRKVALIAPVIERIAPSHKPAVQVVMHHPHAVLHPAHTVPLPPATPPPTPAAVTASVPELVQDQQLLTRHAAPAAAAQRLEAAGLPVPPRLRRPVEPQELKRQAVEHRTASKSVPQALRRQIARGRQPMPPPAVRRNVREAIHGRRAAGEPFPSPPALMRDARPRYIAPDEPAFPSFQDWAAERRERARQYFRSLPPDERREFRREQREERRRFEQDDDPPD